MKVLVLTIINIFIFLAIVGGIVFGFWYMGIFKKGPEMSEKMIKIKDRIEFFVNYPFKESGKYLQNLPNKIYQFPEVQQSEIGRQSLF